MIIKSLRCFCINKHSSNNFSHLGHLKHNNGNVSRGIRDVPTDKLELIRNLFEQYCPMTIAQQFLELSDGVKLSFKSITKLREIVLVRKHNVISDESNAKTLIRLSSDDDRMPCESFIGSYNEATKLVRVCRKLKSKGNKLLIDDKNNLESEYQRFVKEVVLGLSLGNGEFLINTMWID